MTKKISLRETPAKLAASSVTRPDPANKPASSSRITVYYDVGFPNTLYIRGQGGPLSWEKGLPLKNIRANEWVFETKIPFNTLEFKVLVNDTVYELGDNHRFRSGMNFSYTPHFP